MQQPRRQHQRYHLVVPVDFGETPGLTRDVSIGGIYFETLEEVTPGWPIHFWLMFPPADRNGGARNFATMQRANGGRASVRIECNGTVIRVEELEGRFGVAATIDCFESIVAAFKPTASRSRRELDH